MSNETDFYYDDDWRIKAACRDEDPELFFPLGSSSAADRLQIAEAKSICHGCPVLTECRRWTLKFDPSHGVFAGLSEDERAVTRARRKAAGEPVAAPARRRVPIPIHRRRAS